MAGAWRGLPRAPFSQSQVSTPPRRSSQEERRREETIRVSLPSLSHGLKIKTPSPSGGADLNRINRHHHHRLPMAPPTPPASASTSGKKKDKDKAGGSAKKKVTPAQVAFLVERYLADNGFHAALAAFRSDAAHLFKPHHHKPAPKGLLPLADILHDYIALKESRVAIDSAMHAMHSLVSTYYTSNPPPAPPMRLPPPAGAVQPASPPLVPPLFVASSSSPPQGTLAPHLFDASFHPIKRIRQVNI